MPRQVSPETTPGVGNCRKIAAVGALEALWRPGWPSAEGTGTLPRMSPGRHGALAGPYARLPVRLPAGIALAAAAACTRVSDTSRFEPISERLEILETIPGPGATDVPPNAQIDFCFSGTLDPRSLDAVDAALRSGTFKSFDIQLDLQLFAWRAPGDSSGASSAPWCPGSVLSIRAKEPLVPGVLHRARLLPTASGWAGEALDVTTPGWVAEAAGPRYVLNFYVQAPGDDDKTVPLPPPPSLTDLFAPGQVFGADNPACSCHRDEGDLAHARLDLSSPQDAFAGLVLPTEPQSTGFPMVSPRRPSESFLVQVLLRDDDGEALHGVRGDPMPPDAPLPYADKVQIVRWIEGGALP